MSVERRSRSGAHLPCCGTCRRNRSPLRRFPAAWDAGGGPPGRMVPFLLYLDAVLPTGIHMTGDNMTRGTSNRTVARGVSLALSAVFALAALLLPARPTWAQG